MVRIGLLIERVTSYGEGRTLTILGKWLEDKVILAQIAKHTVTTATRQCADSSTLENLTHMQCECTIEALLDSKAGEDARVIRTPCDDDICTTLECLYKRLLAHLSDDADGLFDVLLCSLGSWC